MRLRFTQKRQKNRTGPDLFSLSGMLLGKFSANKNKTGENKGETRGERLLCHCWETGVTSVKKELSLRSKGFWKFAASSSQSEVIGEAGEASQTGVDQSTHLVVGAILMKPPRGGLQNDVQLLC